MHFPFYATGKVLLIGLFIAIVELAAVLSSDKSKGWRTNDDRLRKELRINGPVCLEFKSRSQAAHGRFHNEDEASANTAQFCVIGCVDEGWLGG